MAERVEEILKLFKGLNEYLAKRGVEDVMDTPGGVLPRSSDEFRMNAMNLVTRIGSLIPEVQGNVHPGSSHDACGMREDRCMWARP